MAPTVDGSAAMPDTTTEATGALEADAGVADAVPKSIAEREETIEGNGDSGGNTTRHLIF